MSVCACDECDCIITLEPTLPDGAICDWCESDKHGKPLPILTEHGATLDITNSRMGIVLTTRWPNGTKSRVFLNADAARKLADQLDLAIIGGGQ